MCKLHFCGFGGSPADWVKRAGLAVFILLGLAATTGWSQPANDNFARATVISSEPGTVTGSNVGATAEPGEPVITDNGGGKTVWYKWKADFTGTISFNTEGSAFDTVMGAYIGTSVSSLTQLAVNDDVNYPVDLTSAISFACTNGATYYIGVDGFLGDAGTVLLSWQQTGGVSAGNFFFAAPAEPSTPAAGVPYHPASTPVYNFSDLDGVASQASTYLRVTRATGASGRVYVDYVITNVYFTTITQTNVYGTNLLMTNYDTNMTAQSYTNTYSTNFFVIEQVTVPAPDGSTNICNLTNGYQLTAGRQVNVTNANGTRMTTSTVNVVSNAFQFCSASSGTNTVTNNGVITITITNIFCTNYSGTNKLVPSAVAGTDYEPASGTLEFEDYEMGKWIPLDILGNTAALQNRLVVAQLSNARLDPNEAGVVASPTIDQAGGLAEVVLQSVLVPAGQTTSDSSCLTNQTGGQNVFNIEGTVFYLPYGYDEGIIPSLEQITVYRANPNGQSSVTLEVTSTTNPITYNNTFNLQPGSDYANPNPPDGSTPSTQPPNYQIKSQTLTFQQGVISVTIIGTPYFEPITNAAVTFNEDLQILLANPQNGVLGQSATATATIGFHNQPPGAVDRDHNMDFQRETIPPYNTEPGANNQVYAVAIQPDNKTVLAGDFTAYDTTPRNRVARMNADGQLDTTFAAAPNSGADGVVTCLALQNNGSVIIGGDFSAYNGTSRNGIARLDSGGNLDTTFNPGFGVNGTVSCVAVQPNNGQVLVAGNFTSVNVTNRNSIARLNPDGSLDTTFDPGIGPNDTIEAMAVQLDGKIVIGGDFTSVDNSNLNYVARLNADGSLDTSFNPAVGPDGSVLGLAVQNDQKIVLGGAFQNVNLIGRGHIARLNTDGSLDAGFDPGTGFDANVNVVTMESDGKVLAGGYFKTFNSTRRVGIARLLPYGSLDTSFMDTAFNQFAGVVKDFYNDGYQPRNFLDTIAVQADGNIIIGGSFDHLGGETNKDFGFNGYNGRTPSGGTWSIQGAFTRDGIGQRRNIARLIGNFPVVPNGPAVLNPPAPGNIGLSYSSYSADKDAGLAYVTMYRTNGDLGPASVTFSPIPGVAGPGVAVPNVDFTLTTGNPNPVWDTVWSSEWEYADCFLGPNFQEYDNFSPDQYVTWGTAAAYISLLNNTNSKGDLSLSVGISQPQSSDIFFLGGENIPIGVALDNNVTAPMTIVDPTLNHGVIGFSSNAFSVSEGGTNAIISLVRTGGSVGDVYINYATVSGGTGVNGHDYSTTTGQAHFKDGQTVTNFKVGIIAGIQQAPDKTVFLQLSNPTGGATAGLTNAVLTIINNNFTYGRVNFSSTNFSAHEESGAATITVTRTGGSQNILTVNYVSGDGTATNGQNYGAVSNTLTWNSGDVTPKTFTVPLIHDSQVTSNLTVNLSLINPQVNGVSRSLALGLQSNAVLTIINDDFYGRSDFQHPDVYGE